MEEFAVQDFEDEAFDISMYANQTDKLCSLNQEIDFMAEFESEK